MLTRPVPPAVLPQQRGEEERHGRPKAQGGSPAREVLASRSRWILEVLGGHSNLFPSHLFSVAAAPPAVTALSVCLSKWPRLLGGTSGLDPNTTTGIPAACMSLVGVSGLGGAKARHHLRVRPCRPQIPAGPAGRCQEAGRRSRLLTGTPSLASATEVHTRLAGGKPGDTRIPHQIRQAGPQARLGYPTPPAWPPPQASPPPHVARRCRRLAAPPLALGHSADQAAARPHPEL